MDGPPPINRDMRINRPYIKCIPKEPNLVAFVKIKQMKMNVINQ